MLTAVRAAAAAAEMKAWEQAARAATASAQPAVVAGRANASSATATASTPPTQPPVVLVPSGGGVDDIPAGGLLAAGVGESWQAPCPSPAEDADRTGLRLESLPIVAWCGVGGQGSPTVATAPMQP